MTIAISGTTGITLDGQFNSASSFGFRNRIINGAMVIDQRNAGASVSNPDGLYIVDRWIYQSSQNSKVTIQQNQNSVTPPAGFTYYSGITSSSAYTVVTGDYFLYRQKIEGFNVADLAWGTASAATVTLSFWVRSSLTGTFGGALLNSAQNRSYPFSYTISSTNTWEQKSITIAGDTSGTWLTTNGIGIHVGFSLGTGSTYSGTAGAWSGSALFSATGATSVVGTSGATFYITGVQLEKGSTATSFDYRPYGTELALCQRYYQRFENSLDVTDSVATGTVWTSTLFFMVLPYITTMRATPTGSYSGVTALTLLVNTAAKQTTAISFNGYSKQAVEVLGTSSSMTGGQAGFVRFTAAGNFLALSAEL